MQSLCCSRFCRASSETDHDTPGSAMVSDLSSARPLSARGRCLHATARLIHFLSVLASSMLRAGNLAPGTFSIRVSERKGSIVTTWFVPLRVSRHHRCFASRADSSPRSIALNGVRRSAPESGYSLKRAVTLSTALADECGCSPSCNSCLS